MKRSFLAFFCGRGFPRSGLWGGSPILVSILLSGCAVGPDFVSPQPPDTVSYGHGSEAAQTAAADGVTQTFHPGEKVPADWWRLFGSPKMNAVIEDALAGSPSLEAAQARLRQSQDLLKSGHGVFYPSVTGDANAARQKSAPQRSGADGPASIFNLFTLSATVSYALDIFGGQRRYVEELGAQADYQAWVEKGAALTLTVNVANAMIAKAAYAAELNATRELIRLQEEQVRMAEVRVDAGTGAYTSVLGLRSQLETIRATMPQLEQKLNQADHLLAALAGHLPSQWQAPDIAFDDLVLPRDVPLDVPSDLVRRRPDIQASEQLAHAASAEVGVATAAMFPSFTLSGTYGYGAMSTATLFGNAAKFWSFGGDAALSIFDGGTLDYKRLAAKEAFQSTMGDYRQTVLDAFQQTADLLNGLEHDAQALQSQKGALDAARDNLTLVQANFTAGLAAYTDVLIADQQYQQTVISYLQTKASRYQDTVALFAALGGGW